jgi:hypothetical protein
MSLERQVEVLKRIEQVAMVAGMRGVIDEQRMAYRMGFNLDSGRRQMVLVRFAGQTGTGDIVVTFLSPCLVVKKNFLSGISKAQAVDLLKRNANLMIARYGIWDSETESAIVASVDRFLDNLDSKEFEANALCVALAADHYEREHGQDEF